MRTHHLISTGVCLCAAAAIGFGVSSATASPSAKASVEHSVASFKITGAVKQTLSNGGAAPFSAISCQQPPQRLNSLYLTQLIFANPNGSELWQVSVNEPGNGTWNVAPASKQAVALMRQTLKIPVYAWNNATQGSGVVTLRGDGRSGSINATLKGLGVADVGGHSQTISSSGIIHIKGSWNCG
jgi:hypothetical protein